MSVPVTPVLLVRDEAVNLARTLDALAWAPRVLLVDSGSADGSLQIAASRKNVVVVTHPYEGPPEQWRFALSRPEIETPFVLALDADMVVPPEFVREMTDRWLPGGFAGGLVPFRYLVAGRPLLGSLYPPDLRLFDRAKVRVEQRGHTHVFRVDGRVYRFRARLLHDDRKPVERFFAGQVSYSRREAQRLAVRDGIGIKDRLRENGCMAPLMFLLAYLKAGGPLRGKDALRYAHERCVYESMLGLRLLASRDETRRNGDA